MSINKTEIYIEEYSEKSFVVRGDTRPYRDSLKALGGKWANRLTDKNNGEKFGAWLFWSAKLPEVNTWIKKGCKTVEGCESQRSEKGSYDTTSRLESRISAIEVTLAKLEKLTQAIYSCVIDGEIVEEEDTPAPKRLLR